MARRFGMPSSERKALLKNQVSNLLWYGKIETTAPKAKDVARLAEKYITLAMRTYEDTKKVTKTDDKGNTFETVSDGSKKLAARRKLMANLNDIQEIKDRKESKSNYRERTKDVSHPLIEKLFNDYAPKYAKRKAELGQGGGYTRVLKLGSRSGDAAETAIVELI